MIPAPIREEFGTPEWVRWFTQAVSCLPWRRAASVVETIDFGLILENNELGSDPITVPGARKLDTVLVAPEGNISCLTYKGVVTANDRVTVYAVNSAAVSMNPGSMQFRITVLMN